MYAQLVLSANSIAPISSRAANEFRNKQSELRLFVDTQFAAQPNVEQLLGGNPFPLLSDNHLHHVRFMSNIFMFNSFSLLARIVPWVYRAYHKQGVSYDYFPLALRHWQTAVRQSLQPESVVQILSVYDWLLRHHGDFVQLAENPTERLFSGPDAQDPFIGFCLEKLFHGDYAAFSAQALDFLNNGNELGDLYTDLLQPCLYEVGRQWESGNISVAQEHLATAIVHRTMFQAFSRFRLPQEQKGKAVIAAAPNEFHELGAHMAADLLMLDGWQVLYLGANTPQQELLALLLNAKPCILGLSVVLPFNLDYAQDIILKIRASSELQSLKVMVGGLAFAHEASIWKKIGADAYAKDAKECVKQALEWWEQSKNEA